MKWFILLFILFVFPIVYCQTYSHGGPPINIAPINYYWIDNDGYVDWLGLDRFTNYTFAQIKAMSMFQYNPDEQVHIVFHNKTGLNYGASTTHFSLIMDEEYEQEEQISNATGETLNIFYEIMPIMLLIMVFSALLGGVESFGK